MTAMDLSRKTVLTYIIERFGVDLHDYLVTSEHPLHQSALAAENIARAMMTTTARMTETAGRVRQIVGSADRDRSIAAATLNDLTFLQGSHHAYEETLRLVIQPLRPRPQT